MKVTPNATLIVATLLIAIAVGFSVGRTSLPATGDAKARNEAIAENYYRQGDASQAFSLFEKLAKQGDASAAYYLGDMYEFGNGVSVDGDKAVKWLTVAANAGNARAARQLGLLYRDGTVEVQDFALARKWLDLAARAGDPAALRSLGDMNAQGFGAPADPVAAYAYYSVAALRGDGSAALSRDRLAEKLDASQQRQGEKQAEAIRQTIAAPAPKTATGKTGAGKTS